MASTTILFIVPSLAPGGTEKKTIMIANKLSAKGNKVFLAYLNEPDYFLGTIDNRVSILKVGRKSKLDFQAIKKIRNFIRCNNITRIVAMNLYPMLYAHLSTLLMRNQVKVFVSINTTEFWSIKGALQMLLYVPIIVRMDKIIFGCQYQKNLWTKKYRIPKSISTVIYNGVDTALYSVNRLKQDIAELRTHIGIRNDEVVIGTVGRLLDEKGHGHTLECTRLLLSQGFKIKLILVGDGPNRKKYENLARNMGIDKSVFFAGNQTDVRGYIAIMDIFVLSSIAVETFSNALLEAMSMSKPVVATDISGTPEMIKDGENGFLVKPASAQEIANAIKKLISVDRRQLISSNARVRIEREFSVERMIADYESILELNR